MQASEREYQSLLGHTLIYVRQNNNNVYAFVNE